MTPELIGAAKTVHNFSKAIMMWTIRAKISSRPAFSAVND
jgi:hypothetical protein